MQCTCTGTSFSCSMTAQNCWKSLFGRVLEIDRDVDVGHAETVNSLLFIRQRLLMGVETKVDDVLHAEILDFCELRLGRLTGGRYPTVQTMPVVNAFRGRPLATPHMTTANQGTDNRTVRRSGRHRRFLS